MKPCADTAIKEKFRVSFSTLGCKLNFAETATLSRSLDPASFQVISEEMPSDIWVVNSCTVTFNAEKKLHQLIRKTKSRNPNCFVIVVGCYANLRKKEIAAIEGVNLVLANHEKYQLPHLLSQHFNLTTTSSHGCESLANKNFYSAYSTTSRSRAFLKIQDGCNYKCSYCTIPAARGHSRSDTIENILTNIFNISKQGIKEIVLTGVNTADFSIVHKGKKLLFYDLLTILEHHSAVRRIRISSIEPNLVTEKIIQLLSESVVFVPHFHLPLQSGCNKILRMMRRRYSTELYQERVKKIKKMIPDGCIGADVITGFPTETTTDFNRTYDFIEQLDIAYLHVFPYSSRPNTEAQKYTEAVNDEERKHRSKMLRYLSEKKKKQFYNTQLNKVHNVLFEFAKRGPYLQGLTENYLKVRIPWQYTRAGKIEQLTIKTIDADGYARTETTMSDNKISGLCHA